MASELMQNHCTQDQLAILFGSYHS